MGERDVVTCGVVRIRCGRAGAGLARTRTGGGGAQRCAQRDDGTDVVDDELSIHDIDIITGMYRVLQRKS